MPNRSGLKLIFIVAWILGVASQGCSTWHQGDIVQSVPRLPQAQMSRNSVGVEIATVTFDAANQDLLQSIRQELDEQVLDADLRRHLANNGFVAGSLGPQLPSAIQVLLMEAADRREHPTAENQVDAPDQQRYVHCRAGVRRGIGLWGAAEKLKLRHHQGELVIPKNFDDATMTFGMRCKQSGRSVADISLRPELKHGPIRQKYVIESGSSYWAAQQDTIDFADLEMKFAVASGETVLITCTNQAEMLGTRMFRNQEGTRQKILLVRLAQTQVDLTFEDE